jgi:hypothetical protein
MCLPGSAILMELNFSWWTKIWPTCIKNVITKINLFLEKMFSGVAKVRLEILFFFPNNFFIMGVVKFDGLGNYFHLK